LWISNAFSEDRTINILAPESYFMDKDTLAMARGNYGYGRWEAPNWFIGPEQGMADHTGNNLALRVEVWRKRGSRGLDDCREFHRDIKELQWHFKEPVSLQSTWRPLMLLLMNFLGRPVGNDYLRVYQRDRWGSLDEKAAETCVIELSGLAAPNLQENPDPGIYLQERIEVICPRILDHQPRLVVMYGTGQRRHWNTIAKAVAGREFPREALAPDLPGTSVLTHGAITLVRTPHATARGLSNEYWTGLGKRLREL
jgi:hypothetical protein